MKKIFALVLSLIMVTSAFGAVAISAADEAQAELTVNDSVVYTGTFDVAFAKSRTYSATDSVTVKLLRDFTFDNKTYKFMGDAPVTIDGDGHTVQAAYTGQWDAQFFIGVYNPSDGTNASGKGELTVKNLTISNTTTRNLFKLWFGTLNMENVNVKSVGGGIVFTVQAENKACADAVSASTSVEGLCNVALNVTGGTYITDTSNQAFLSSNSKYGDVEVTVDGTSVVAYENNAQNIMYLDDGHTATVNTHKLVIKNSSVYVPAGKLIISLNSGLPEARLSDSSFYAPFVYGNSQNRLIVRASTGSGKVTAVNVDFFGSANKGAPISFNNWQTAVAAGNANDGITLTSYEQAGTAAPTAKEKSNVPLPVMEAGASVRLAEDDTSGIRFTSNISKTAIDYYAAKADEGTAVTYGTICVLSSELAKYNVTADNFNGTASNEERYQTYVTPELLELLGVNYLDIVAENGITRNDDGSVSLRAAVYGIDEDNYSTEITAFAYAKVIVNGEAVYYCSPVRPTDNNRSIETVAAAAVVDTTVTYAAWQMDILKKYAGIND